MSNGLDADQDLCLVGPDLGLNCLQRLSADDTSEERFLEGKKFEMYLLYKHTW